MGDKLARWLLLLFFLGAARLLGQPSGGDDAVNGELLRAGDGTVSAPGASFATDDDNGRYLIGADNFAWAVGGNKFFELGGSQSGLFTDSTPTTGDPTFVFKEGAATANNLVEMQTSAGDVGWAFLTTTQLGAGSSGTLQIRAFGGSGSTEKILFAPLNNFTRTASNQIHFLTQPNFAPTSGTATFADIQMQAVINQTGGANGITRGLFCNPTLTASADFRCIDIALGGLRYSSGGTFGTGTGPSYGDGDTECFESADDIWQCTTAGTANGFQLDATGDLTAIGTGTITATGLAANALAASSEITDGTVAPVDMTNAARDMKFSFNLPAPVTGDDGDYQIESPVACTLIEVACNVQAATSVTINLYERARATAETGTTNMITTSPVCVTGGDVETAFDDAALAANVPLALGVSAVSGTPALLRVHVTCRRD